MKTNADYALLAKTISEQYSAEYITQAIALLRSIELDAWREAREVVDKKAVVSKQDGVLAPRPNPALPEMDRIIQQLQLK